MAPTIYDIARQAGVSITTVSHALSGRGRVSPATRERILRLAAEIGYAANPHARSLVSGRSWTIAIQVAGFTTEHSGGMLLPDAAYFMDLLNGAASAAAENDYAIVLAPYDFNPIGGQHLALDGAVIVDPSGEEALAVALAERGLPVVTTGRPTRGKMTYPWVDNDHAGTALRMLGHFAARGYTRPALIATTASRSYVADIVAAYRGWSAEHGLDPRIVELPEPPSERAAARAARRLLSGDDPPDAIFATYDRLAMGVLLAAQRLGIPVPGGLGLASAVDSDLLRRISPSVTSVSLNARGIGRIAVEVLVSMIEASEPAQSGIVVATRILPRTSTAARGGGQAAAANDPRAAGTLRS
ncbi:MAG: LacI family transcriptional regulator [Actinomycetota bacterium]|nr:LacI family transcriptional regulator [Actinomycetota bacterium]